MLQFIITKEAFMDGPKAETSLTNYCCVGGLGTKHRKAPKSGHTRNWGAPLVRQFELVQWMPCDSISASYVLQI